jgi:hypothetical protein
MNFGIRAFSSAVIRQTHSTGMARISVSGSDGFSALEILIGLSSLIVVVVFAGSLWSLSAAEAEMKDAVAGVKSSVLAARQAAMIYQTDVVLHVSPGNRGPQTLSYSVPSTRKLDVLPELQKSAFVLPEGVRLVATRDSILFDLNGKAESPVQLLLVSTNESDVVEDILVR